MRWRAAPHRLQEYGLYVGGVIDGASRKVLGLIAMGNKLPSTIYDELFAPVVRTYGFPDQLVSDKGNEWRLLAFACFLAARLAQRLGGRLPHRFTSSQHNVSAAASLST